MSIYHRSSEKRRIYHEFRRQEEEVIGSLCRLGSRPSSPKSQLEQEKRIRREIANSNERRRMQSINAGFQSLRTLLPHHEGEKLSKAAILQHTSEFIYQLEQEKTRLLTQNCHLKRLLNNQLNPDSDASSLDSPLPKRKKPENLLNYGAIEKDFDAKKHWKTQAESSDEGIGNMSPSGKEPTVEDLRRELLELRVQLDRERRLRMVLEDQNQSLLQDEDLKEDNVLSNTNNQMEITFQYQTENTSEENFSKEQKPHDHILDTALPMSVSDQEDIPSRPQAENETNLGFKCISLITSMDGDEIPEDLSSATKTIIIANSLESIGNHEYQIEPSSPRNETPCISIPSPPHPSPSHSPLLHSLANSVPILPAEVSVKMDTIGSEISISSLSTSESNPRLDGQATHMATLPQTPIHMTSQQQPRLYHASTSRQNLETIVEAIRHLEGDHLFRDDPKPAANLETLPISSNKTSTESPPETDQVVVPEEVDQVSADSQRSLCTIALQNGGHEYAVRQRVIHCSPSTLLPLVGNSMRPGVIVSNHT